MFFTYFFLTIPFLEGKQEETQDYGVDVNGNLKDDGRYQYTWNALDQLTTVKDSADNTVATYEYDENDRRIYSKVGTTETYYRYDGTSNQVLFESSDKEGSVTKSYTYDEAGHPLTMTYNGETYYYLTNYRGDVLTLTNASGNAVAEYTYDAWGNILTQTGSMANINPYRYAGYRYDEETKLYYLMARYYNPDTGVFLSLDPVRGDTMNPITMNGYNYANNNPVMMVDPDGEMSTVFKKRMSYAFKKALENYLKKWKTSRDILQKIVATTVGAILGLISIKKDYNKNKKKFSSHSAQVKALGNTNYAKSIIKEARKDLYRRLGKRAAASIIGGVAGFALYEVVEFSADVIYYAMKYKV